MELGFRSFFSVSPPKVSKKVSKVWKRFRKPYGDCMQYDNLTLQCETHKLHDRNGLTCRWPTRPKRSDHPRSRGVDLSDQWRFSVKPKTHPPFSAKRRPAKRPPNLADRGRTLAETAELSTFPAYWSVRLATQCQTRAVREKVRVGLRQYRYYIGKPFKSPVKYSSVKYSGRDELLRRGTRAARALIPSHI
jgi:hypothetical protein